MDIQFLSSTSHKFIMPNKNSINRSKSLLRSNISSLSSATDRLTDWIIDCPAWPIIRKIIICEADQQVIIAHKSNRMATITRSSLLSPIPQNNNRIRSSCQSVRHSRGIMRISMWSTQAHTQQIIDPSICPFHPPTSDWTFTCRKHHTRRLSRWMTLKESELMLRNVTDERKRARRRCRLCSGYLSYPIIKIEGKAERIVALT